jgi:hypothetical protein
LAVVVELVAELQIFVVSITAVAAVAAAAW